METAADTTATGAKLFKDRLKYPSLRSKMTNGTRVFAIGGDGRGAWTRRWKDLFEAHIADIGGLEGLSEAQISLSRRCAAIEVQLEQMEAQMSAGNLDVDLDLYGRLSSHLRRIFESIGIERKAKPIRNSVIEHFASPAGRRKP